MKKLIFTLALATGVTMGLSAQVKTQPSHQKQKQERASLGPEDRAKAEADRAEKEFGLDASQKAKWESAALTRIKANAPVREKMKGSTTPEERKNLRAEAKTNLETFDREVNGFLNESQKQKWEAHKKERHSKRAGKRKGPEDHDHDQDLDMD